MKKPIYDWLGSWEGPEHGEYVIREDTKELEPSEVIQLLNDYQDLIEQEKAALVGRGWNANPEKRQKTAQSGASSQNSTPKLPQSGELSHFDRAWDIVESKKRH